MSERDQQTLTEEDFDKYGLALEKLTRKLFEEHSLSDYGIIRSSIGVIGPTVVMRRVPVTGEGRRQLLLGGMRSEFTNPRAGIRTWVEICHVGGRLFNVFGSWGTEERSYVRVALTVDFGKLDVVVLRILRMMRTEQAQFL